MVLMKKPQGNDEPAIESPESSEGSTESVVDTDKVLNELLTFLAAGGIELEKRCDALEARVAVLEDTKQLRDKLLADIKRKGGRSY